MSEPSATPLEARIAMPLRWSDTDAMGHVYHGVHISLIEEARTLWLNRATGGDGLWLHVVVRVAIDYRSPLMLDDGHADVTCVGSRLGRSSIGTTEVVRSPTGRLISESESVVVAWDEAAGGSRQLTEPERREVLKALGSGPGGDREERR